MLLLYTTSLSFVLRYKKSMKPEINRENHDEQYLVGEIKSLNYSRDNRKVENSVDIRYSLGIILTATTHSMFFDHISILRGLNDEEFSKFYSGKGFII